MPTTFRDDQKPIVTFDPRLEVSPFSLFRELCEGRAPLLIDIRDHPSGKTLRGAQPLTGPDWRPSEDQRVVLFDDDGSRSVLLAAELQAEGFLQVRALFGGLELYDFSLDPQVVETDTHLIDL
jgi:hypothetical protein